MSPRVSVIIPAYNVQRYLREAVDSVISQSIGFVDNIELIIVDDGSTDGTSQICEEYREKYPQNIIYIHKKNTGVSSTRNVGLRKARAEYVHFLDADDILSKNFYSESISFLERERGVDFVASKILFFDEIIDSHPLNYKFSHGERVIDLKVEPDAPILHVITAVFKKKSLNGRKFDERLSIAEDVKFLNDVLIDKKKYGVITDTTYYYRKRSDGFSAIGGKELNKSYYLDTPALVYSYIQQLWGEDSQGTYADYLLAYEIAYRLDQAHQSLLTDKEAAEYKKAIELVVCALSTPAIVKSRFLSVDKKIYILQKKTGERFSKSLSTEGARLLFDGHVLYDFEVARAHIDFLEEEKDYHKIGGYIDAPVHMPKVSVHISNGTKNSPVTFVQRAQLEKSFLGVIYKTGNAFEAKVAVPEGAEVSVVVSVGECEVPLRLETGPFTRFGALKLTYRKDGDLLLKRRPRAIEVYRYTVSRFLRLESRMWFQILLNWRFNSARIQFNKLRSRNLAQLGSKAKIFEILKPFLIVGEAVVMIPRALILRLAYHLAEPQKKRPIWIISDRGMAAGDNGEALFRYIMSIKNRKQDVYFVISKKSKDYARMKATGPTLTQESMRYKLKFLLADKIISSQADIETTNPFIRQGDHYVDLFNFDFVFLQHGVIRHDLSGWLNRFNKNIKTFVVSAQKEYDSIFSNPYYYGKDEVLLSGLPRYDLLRSEPARKVILAPTYRKNLAKQKTDKNGQRRYDMDFKNSEYRKFYNGLMNDDRVTSAMSDAGYTGEFYLHPALSAQREDFDSNDVFRVMNFPYDYKTAFREGELLISDHSSVVFDFAYLKKPVLYAYFDVSTFFQNHSYDASDFFSDRDDGFGVVCDDYESLVHEVVAQIKQGPKMDAKYKKRVDDFFEYTDSSNCKRVYDAIVKA